MLENGTTDGFKPELVSPDKLLNRDEFSSPYTSPYEISYWHVSSIDITEPKTKFIQAMLHDKSKVKVNVHYIIGSLHKVKQERKQTHTSTSQLFEIPIKEYLNLKRKSDFKAYILLPDFLEKTAPFTFSIMAFFVGFYTVFV